MTDQPKVLMVAPQPYFEPRGVLISIYTRLRALTKLDCSVHLVTFPVSEDKIPDGVDLTRIWNVFCIMNIPVGPSIRKFLLEVILLFYLFGHLCRHSDEYEVLHCHEEAAFFCTPLSYFFRLPLIYDYHSNMAEIATSSDLYGREPFLSLFRKVESFGLKHAHRIICVLPSTGRKLRQTYGKKRVFLVENLAPEVLLNDEQISTPDPEVLESEHDVTRLVYTGSLQNYQILDELVEALAQAENRSELELVIVGGNSEKIEDLRKTVTDFGLSSRVTLVGRIPNEELPPVLDSADVLISSRSTGENVPLKLFTYLWAGKPIMATDIPSHRSILDEGDALWVDPSVEGFREGLESLDDTDLESLARRSRRKFRKKYSCDQFVKKHEPYLDELLRIKDS